MGTHLKADKDYKMGRKRKPIPQECIDLLGKMKDSELSSMYKLKYQTVRSHRIELGIPRFTQELPEEYMQLLGKMKDTQISRLSGVPYAKVSMIRRAKGIAIYRTPPDSDRKIADIDSRYPGIGDRLGQETDAGIARSYNISRERVRQFRKMFDISRSDYGRVGSVAALSDVDKEYLIKNLGIITDADLSKQLGINASVIYTYRKSLGIDSALTKKRKLVVENKHRLGVDSDHMIARELGVTPAMIRNTRIKFGIKPNPKYNRRWTAEAYRDGRNKKITTMFYTGFSDEEIAEELGMHKQYVCKLRLGLGLRRNAVRMKKASNK